MKYFKPEFANGQDMALPIQMSAYKYNFLWPLDEQASNVQIFIHYSCAFILLSVHICTLWAEFADFSEHFSDIPAMSECLTTLCTGVQYSIRVALCIKHQAVKREILNRFFKEIYFTAADDAELRQEIHKKMRVPDFFTKSYYVPMMLIYVVFFWEIYEASTSNKDKPYIYRMSFHWYDAQQPLAYIITSIYTGWLTFSVTSLMSAEDFTICLMLCHTSFRIKALHKRLDNILEEAHAEWKNAADKESIHCIFRRKLYTIIQKQQKLHSFILQAKAHFTHQIFYCLMFGVALLCCIAFQFQRLLKQSTIGLSWAKYIFWMNSQTSQFIMIGYFGQMLTDAISEMQVSYYTCGWEAILQNGHVRENKLLMNDIRFAIMNAQDIVVMDGLKLVTLTHNTIGSAIRSAASYFMFLNTMNNRSKK